MKFHCDKGEHLVEATKCRIPQGKEISEARVFGGVPLAMYCAECRKSTTIVFSKEMAKTIWETLPHS